MKQKHFALTKLFKHWQSILALPLVLINSNPVVGVSLPNPDETVECEILIIGGGFAGIASAYESLLAGKTVCLTEITDWVGGQISAQGTSALDERKSQRDILWYPRGYLELRKRIEKYYGELNPGNCWVSKSCFLPDDGNKILFEELQNAAKKGKATLKWFPSTVVKDLTYIPSQGKNKQIDSVIAIQHQPASGAPPLNTYPLSETIEDWYRYENSDNFTKKIIRFVPLKSQSQKPANWFVIEATETGEIVGLTNVPYRLGVDPRSYLEPSASSTKGDPYCTQGFTYPFAMEKTPEAQPQTMPVLYPQYAPYYSYELPRLADFDLVFTYRRIWNPHPGEPETFGGITFIAPTPGDISMQNWTWGNDYRPGTSEDNFVYTKEQLESNGQLQPGGWMGGLRTEALRKGEQHSLGYYYWLVAGTTDSQLGEGVKKPQPDNKFLSGLDSPMGTVHGLSKYPYIREGRRIIGRKAFGYPNGFGVNEIDISRLDYRDDFYKQNLDPDTYRRLHAAIAGLEGLKVLDGEISPDEVGRRKRSTIYPDAVGIGYYAIDLHPCMVLSPPETPGNKEKPGERQGQGLAYPFQIPLRSMIPQEIDNLLISGKSIAVSHIAAAAYRTHSFEWSVGAAAGTTAAFALDHGIMPYDLVSNLPETNQKLRELQKLLNSNNNPTAFPDTSIFNNTWDEWQ